MEFENALLCLVFADPVTYDDTNTIEDHMLATQKNYSTNYEEFNMTCYSKAIGHHSSNSLQGHVIVINLVQV